jgi:hypothetical protein
MIIRDAGSLMRWEGDCVRTPRTGKVGKELLLPPGCPTGLSVRWTGFDTRVDTRDLLRTKRQKEKFSFEYLYLPP